MKGIEILTSAQVATEWGYCWTAFWITSSIIFVVFTVVGIWETVIDSVDVGIIPILSIVGIILGVLFGGASGAVFEKPTAYETQYKITISKDVSMTEFYEHYEVIEIDGKIFTVREKTK